MIWCSLLGRNWRKEDIKKCIVFLLVLSFVWNRSYDFDKIDNVSIEELSSDETIAETFVGSVLQCKVASIIYQLKGNYKVIIFN